MGPEFAAIAVGLLGACDGRAAPSFAEPVHFSVGDSAYVISAVDARLGGLGDERVVFGSILDVDRTASGWVVVDGLADHSIVLLDDDLNPVGITGQAGEGPGEFQAAVQLSVLGDTLTAAENATWQYDPMGVQIMTKVDPLADGSLFLSVRHGAAVGYVVDTASLTATPIVIGDDWPWLRPQYFDGRRLVLGGGQMTRELVLATTELVPRSIAEGAERPERGRLPGAGGPS